MKQVKTHTQDLNLVEHYPQCYTLFAQQVPSLPNDDWKILTWKGDFPQLKKDIGYRAAYGQVVNDIFGLQ